MKQPKRVLDLFCGAGGAAMGLHQAWPDAEIVGVDINPQPRFPFKFIQGDAMSMLANFSRASNIFFEDGEPDFIWASPPCQGYSVTAVWHGREHPDLIPKVRRLLTLYGIPWVIENVPKAPMRGDFMLCASHFGQPRLRRHRFFEVSWDGPHLNMNCNHAEFPAITVCGHGGRASGQYHNSPSVWRQVMEIPWMNRHELSEAIPPYFSRYIAQQWSAQT